MGFTLVCGVPGSTATIKLYYYGTYDIGKLALRKWQNNAYVTVPGAVFTNQTIGGQPVVKVVYQITDGSSLDNDGVANGNIVDPAGLAVLGTATGAPNTGLRAESSLLPWVVILSGTSLIGLAMRNRKSGL